MQNVTHQIPKYYGKNSFRLSEYYWNLNLFITKELSNLQYSDGFYVFKSE